MNKKNSQTDGRTDTKIKKNNLEKQKKITLAKMSLICHATVAVKSHLSFLMTFTTIQTTSYIQQTNCKHFKLNISATLESHL